MNNKSILLIILLAGALAFSAALNIKQVKDSRADRKRLSELSQNTVNGQAKIITRYVHDSIEHVVIKEVPVANAAEKSIAVGSGYLDTLTKALSIAVNKVDEATKVNATLIAENIQLRQQQGAALWQYRDRWLKLDYNPDSNTVDLNYDVSLNIAKYWKRSWLIGSKKYYVDIFSDDPRVQVNSVKRFTMAQARQKRFGVGLNASYSYIPFRNTWEPTIGIGVNYNLVEF